MMTGWKRLFVRYIEIRLIIIVGLICLLGFAMVTAVLRTTTETAETGWAAVVIVPGLVAGGLFFVHALLIRVAGKQEQCIWPITGLLVTIGLVLIWRLRGPDAIWQQLTRGWIPGLILVTILIAKPAIIEQIRRRWAFYIGGFGLVLILLTAFLGTPDESGARLSLKIGPLPAIQTTEFVKLSLIIFLAWYIERVVEAAEGRAKVFGWLRLPALKYFIPGLLFVFLATLALVKMSDYGAVPILAGLFVVMFYTGFQSRTFMTTALIGLALSIIVGVILAVAWEPPATIQERVLAFQDPWSEEEVVINGQSTGITISEGPGYQTQQSIYSIVAGGITGTGLGYGTPYYVPLAHSDYIFAAVVEELGMAIALAVLAFFAILFLRMLRLAVVLPNGHVFERLLVVGITVHLVFQIVIMIGGTINLIPPTGVTVPFLSQGGAALMVNLIEVGLVMALASRLG
jgi:cell division protein FtsW (lipid II flippase)